MITSPLTKKTTKLINEIDCQKIIDLYLKMGIDVSRFFKGLDNIQMYRCNETNYQFYYPFSIAGDNSFYQTLDKFDWYYMPWKWEHTITKDLLCNGMNVLEIGCANGDFLKEITTTYNIEAIGVELNSNAVVEARKKGLNIFEKKIEDIGAQYFGYFDVVCSFQVAEHIPNIFEFISNSLNVLKKDGLFIVSVPNNNSFIKYLDAPLNLPPHHMNLWDKKSLLSLQSIFPLQIQKILYEPLQKYHFDGWIAAQINKYLYEERFTKKVIRSIAKIIFRPILTLIYKKITGHTILVIYKKL